VSRRRFLKTAGFGAAAVGAAAAGMGRTARAPPPTACVGYEEKGWWVVEGTSDPAQDYTNLRCALLNYPNIILKGTFNIDQTIAVDGFSGTVKGDKKYGAVLNFEHPSDSVQWKFNECEGEIVLQNLELNFVSDKPASADLDQYTGPDNREYEDGLLEFNPLGTHPEGYHVTLDNLKVSGGEGIVTDYNYWFLVFAKGGYYDVAQMTNVLQTSGSVSVRNCEFMNAFRGFGFAFFTNDFDCAVEDCEFTMIGDTPAFPNRCDGGTVSISGCHCMDTGNIFSSFMANSDIYVTGCTVDTKVPTWVGFGYYDEAVENTTRFFIKKNIFKGPGIGGAGIVLVQSSGGEISNNKFVDLHNADTAAIYLGNFGSPSAPSNMTLKNNNYAHSGLPGWEMGIGCILLDVYTENNRIYDRNFPPRTNMCNQIRDDNDPSTNMMPPGYKGICRPK
jgi:hypothetical protein